MFCRQCGSEIPNEAKFCTFCGTKTVAPKPREDEGLDPRKAKESNTAPDKGAATDESAAQSTNGNATNTASETDEQSSTTATPEEPIAQANNTGETPEAESATNVAISAANEPTSVVATIGNASAETGNATQEQSETSSLKAAVEQNKKRSRRRMPMILLVALALALATSVAYAAYRVYTDIWAPMQQEQQQKAQAEKDAQEAQDAYNGIIEEYSKALKDAKNGELDRNEIAEKYPHVNSEPFPYYSMSLSDSETSDYKYTAKDLNDDGTPELLIGRDMTQYGTIYTSIAVYDIWSYQNGNLVHVESGITRGDYSLRENGVIMSRANGGAYINGYMMMSLNKGKLYSVEDLDQANVTKAQGNWTNLEGISEERIDGTTRTSSDNPQVEYTKYADNSTGADSGTCTAEQFSSMLKDLFIKYPEDTSVEWKTIPTD